MNKDKRPTFYTDKGQPIRAAGILCYVYDKEKNKKIWLFRKQSNSVCMKRPIMSFVSPVSTNPNTKST